MPHSILYLVVGEAECRGKVEVLKCTEQIIETSLGVRLQERQLCHMITNKLFNFFFYPRCKVSFREGRTPLLTCLH